MSPAPTEPPHEPTLLVADSFRVRVNPRSGEAEVRGLDLHLERFTRSVLAAWPEAVGRGADIAGTAASDEAEEKDEADLLRDAALAALFDDSAPRAVSIFAFASPPADPMLDERLRDFLADALPRIAAYGAGFPRLELWGDPSPAPAAHPREPELRLALRPLPELQDTIELRTAGSLALPHPGRKGPNIARLTRLNRELGAEALLLDRRGRALEGATTSLIWWTDDRDESGYCVERLRGARAERVDSVAESLLRAAAQRRLIGHKPDRTRAGGFAEGRPTPAELVGCEVWAVNALHGIRPVTRIDDASLPEPNTRRLQWFRDALDRSWQPLPKK